MKLHVFSDRTATAMCNKAKQNVPFAFMDENKLYDEMGYEIKDYNKICFACLKRTMPNELNKLKMKKANELIKRRDKIRLNKLHSIVKATMVNAQQFRLKQRNETIKRNKLKGEAKRKLIKQKKIHVLGHKGKVLCGIKQTKHLNIVSHKDKKFDIDKIEIKQVCKTCLSAMKSHLNKQALKRQSNFKKIKEQTIKREAKQAPVSETKPSNETINPDKPMGIEINGELTYRIVNNGFDGYKVIYRNKTNNTISDITHNWISYKKAFQVLLSQVNESQKANLVNC